MACNKGQIKVVEALLAKNIPADPLDKYALCVTQAQTQAQAQAQTQTQIYFQL
jgi:hypothetical protein